MLIPFPDLLNKYKIKPKGIVHCGANNGNESTFYRNAGIDNVVWIEALPKVFEELKNNVDQYPENICLNACIGEKDFKTVTFNVSSNNGESSSVFEFDLHSQYHPDVTMVDKIKLTTVRMDTLFYLKNIDATKYDFLNLDLQGSELIALKSMGDLLRNFKYVYCEVNLQSLYKDIPLVNEIDEYLAEFGFVGVDERYTGAGWGDKFYMKKETNSVFRKPNYNLRDGMVNVPNNFLPNMAFPYPPDNHKIFERYYYETFNDKTDREYLPIQWTAYHVNNNYGNNKDAVQKLQEYVDGLDRSKKYYTIHQFDLGTLVDFKDLDILVFGMAGGRIDYCLPLLCLPHKFEYDNPKTIFASFIGRKTHPIRERVIKGLKDKGGCYISEANHDLSAYCSIISHSVFSICARGFGNNSFRIQESLQYGSIPVIVSNERLEPHGIPFEKYGYYIDEKDADNIYEILQEKTVDEITEKQALLKYYYDNYFTYIANKKIILETVKTR